MADGFGRLARVYEGLEQLAYGGLLMRARVAFLNDLRGAEHILILGEGDGRFLVRLLATNPSCAVTVLDSSAGMLRQAEARVAAHPEARSRIIFRHADALTETFAHNTYDAVVTCFFLDVFPAAMLEPLIAKLEPTLKPGGVWLLVDFAAPHTVKSSLSRLYSQTMVPLMYTFFRLQTALPARTIVPPQPLLRAAGLELKQKKDFRGGFVYSQRWCKRP